MAAFLRVNGYRLAFDDIGAFSFLVGLYETGTLRFKELDAWLRQHTILADPLILNRPSGAPSSWSGHVTFGNAIPSHR